MLPKAVRPVAPQARRGSSVDDFNALESELSEMYVRAYMIAEDLDLASIASNIDLRDKYKVRLCADHLVIYSQAEYSTKTVNKPPVRVAAVVYKFGAAVLFGVSPDHSVEADPLLALMRQHRGKAAAHWKAPGGKDAQVYMEDADLVRYESLQEHRGISQQQGSFLLRQLDVGAIRVVSKVLAQSVALRHYHDLASHNLALFNALLEEMSRTGGSKQMPGSELVKFIATCAHMDHTVLQNLGLMNISDIAWNDTFYNHIWDTFRHEYEIAARYESLSTLLTAATDTAKFTLELRQHGRTMRAENWIIGLISFEILLSMYTHLVM